MPVLLILRNWKKMNKFWNKYPNSKRKDDTVYFLKSLHLKTGSPGLEEYYNQQKLDPKFDAILKPSVLLDESLIKYNHAFDEFLRSNPHIENESPRFVHDSNKTLIVLSPYSAEHAFGRKWVTKSYLSTILNVHNDYWQVVLGWHQQYQCFPFIIK